MLLPSQRSGFDDDAKNRLGKVPKGIKIFSSLFLYYRQNQNKNEREKKMRTRVEVAVGGM